MQLQLLIPEQFLKKNGGSSHGHGRGQAKAGDRRGVAAVKTAAAVVVLSDVAARASSHQGFSVGLAATGVKDLSVPVNAGVGCALFTNFSFARIALLVAGGESKEVAFVLWRPVGQFTFSVGRITNVKAAIHLTNGLDCSFWTDKDTTGRVSRGKSRNDLRWDGVFIKSSVLVAIVGTSIPRVHVKEKLFEEGSVKGINGIKQVESSEPVGTREQGGDAVQVAVFVVDFDSRHKDVVLFPSLLVDRKGIGLTLVQHFGVGSCNLYKELLVKSSLVLWRDEEEC